MTGRSGEIAELTGLRGLLALWVVVGHWGTTVPLDFGPLRADLWNVQAVGVFICLSGFVIALTLDRKQEPAAAFLVRRLLRLLPVYLAVLAASVVLLDATARVIAAGPASAMQAARLAIVASTRQHFGLDLWTHVAMLHGLVPPRLDGQAIYAFVGQAWSISLEWQFYLLAPFLLSAIVLGRRRPAAVAVLAGLVLAGHWMSDAFVGNQIAGFAAGIAGYYAWKRARTGALPRWVRPAGWVMLAAATATAAAGPGPSVGLLAWGLVMQCLLHQGAPERLLRRGLSHPALTAAGRISYALYMVHFLVLVGALAAVERLGLGRHGFAAALLALTTSGSLLAAWGLHLGLERPGNAFGRTAAEWLASRSPPVARTA